MSRDLVNHECSMNPQQYLLLNAFAGGKWGRCVQLTIPSDYVQMTFKEAIDFFKTCIAEIEKLEKEYDENPPWWERLKKERGIRVE